MRHGPSLDSGKGPGAFSEAQLGLFRREVLNTGPARTLTNLFADLRRVTRGEVVAAYPERHLQGTRLLIDRTQGHGKWDLYRLDEDLYVVAADAVYDTSPVETVPGEGLVEFHLRLTGVLEMTMPGCPVPVTCAGPKLLMLYQPVGVDLIERIAPTLRDTCVSLYCRPKFLDELARRNGIARRTILEEIDKHGSTSIWHKQAALSPTLLFIGKSLLDCPYPRDIRLMYAEAKAIELLCEVLAIQHEADSLQPVVSECEARQLDTARRMLASNLSSPMRISDIARAVGMSESKLKRKFKTRFGTTIFDYGFECRMHHALELLRCRHMSVGEAAYAVGYRHQTSFAAAFHEFFGFLPSKARTGMH